MSMLYEGLKHNAMIVIVTSTAVETMQLGCLVGMTALTMGIGQEQADKNKESDLKKQEGLQCTLGIVRTRIFETGGKNETCSCIDQWR